MASPKYIYQQVGDFNVLTRIYKQCTKAEAHIMSRLPDLTVGSKTLEEIRERAEAELIKINQIHPSNKFILKKNLSGRVIGVGEFYSLSISYGDRWIASVTEPIPSKATNQ